MELLSRSDGWWGRGDVYDVAGGAAYLSGAAAAAASRGTGAAATAGATAGDAVTGSKLRTFHELVAGPFACWSDVSDVASAMPAAPEIRPACA